jgi:hypothetical protein
LEKKHERESRDSMVFSDASSLLAKVIGDQTAKTKALNDNIVGTNEFEPFPKGWWASP